METSKQVWHFEDIQFSLAVLLTDWESNFTLSVILSEAGSFMKLILSVRQREAASAG